MALARFQTTRTMVRAAWVFGANSQPNQVRFMTSPSSSDAAKRSIDDLKTVSNQMKDNAASHHGFVASRSKEGVKSTEIISEKAKQSAQEAWNATKDVAQKVQNTVAGKAEASAGAVKDHIEAAKNSMNTKK